MNFGQRLLSTLQSIGFAPLRPYTTTAPIHHSLKVNHWSNLWGWKPFSSIIYSVDQLRSQHTVLDVNERIVEIPWIFSQIDHTQVLSILDVGWLESTVAFSLATLGHQVTALDIRAGNLSHPNLTPIIGDICKTALTSNQFDVVILLSTLEHIGLETMYGSVAQDSDDQKALAECYRLLKPGGKLLLTTPVAKTLSQNSFMRFYTPARLKKLLNTWQDVELEYYAANGNRTLWQKVAAAVLPKPPQFGVALVVAKKSTRSA